MKNQTLPTSQVNLPMRTLPQAKDLEEAVLGAMLLEPDGLRLGLELLQDPELFYQRPNQLVFAAIQAAHQAGQAVDILTVVEQAHKLGTLPEIGGAQGNGAFYIASLINRVHSAGNLETHLRILQEHYLKRQLIRTNEVLLGKAFDATQDVHELLAENQANLLQLSDLLSVKKEEHVASVLYRNLLDIQTRRQGKGLTGVPSSCQVITRLTGGWQPSDLVIVAARPSMGKTAYAIAEAKFAAKEYQLPVAVFSLEMSSEQLVNRLMAAEADLNLNQLRRPTTLSDGELVQLHQRVKKLANAPFYIDDTPGLSIQQFRAKATKMKVKYNVALILVDYLQLMQDRSKKNREQEIASISRQLKLVAKELKVPVIALAQLSRAVEQRGGDKRPQLSDLRESGAIEQDADLIIFLYRREYYEKENTDPDWRNKMELIVAKHRNGDLDDLVIDCDLKTMQFGDVGTLPNWGEPVI